MLKKLNSSPWMFINLNPHKSLPLFVTLGIFLGIAQIVAHRYYGSNLGSNLLIARLQFYSLTLASIFTLIARLLAEGLCLRREKSSVSALINHVIEPVSRRTAECAFAAASTVAGFTIVVAISGAYLHAIYFWLFSIYLLSLGEVAVNPLLQGKQSEAFWPATGVIIGLPLGM